MKRLVFLALVALAAWVGWKQWPGLLEHHPQHVVEVRNAGGSTIERLRVIVAGRTFVKDTLKTGAVVHFSFRTRDDSEFQLLWERSDRLGEKHWNGGRVPRGPVVERHEITIEPDDGVVYQTQPIDSGSEH